jgi:hypothetical protein
MRLTSIVLSSLLAASLAAQSASTYRVTHTYALGGPRPR